MGAYYYYKEEETKWGFKSIPGWVDRNLKNFGNCYVGIDLFEKIKPDLKAYFKGKKFEISKSENGVIIVEVKAQ